MTEPAEDFPLRRILVAMDPTSFSAAALDAAAALAARLSADLQGLFVEDPDLLALARFDVVRHVSLATGLSEPLDAERMEQELRSLARQARRQIEHAAQSCGIACSFRVVRGPGASVLAEAAADVDLVVVETTGRPLLGQVRMASVWRVLARQSPASVLMLAAGVAAAAPVIVVTDGSDSAMHALGVAMTLARRLGGPLTVLIADHDRTAMAKVERAVRDMLERAGLAARIRHVTEDDPDKLLRAVQAAGGGIVVAPRRGPLAEGESGARLLDHCPEPLLLTG
jgi:nucleotide-binding universal stress UspA family protein